MQEQTTRMESRPMGRARTGAIGGLAGGLAMAMVMMLVTAVQGMGVFKPLYLIAATVHQPWAMQSGAALGPVLVGALLHMMLSISFGLVFSAALAVVPGAGATARVVGGMVWGVLVLAINQSLVLPLVDPAMVTATNGLLFWWILAHLLFGLVLGTIALTGVPATRQTAVSQPSRVQPRPR